MKIVVGYAVAWTLSALILVALCAMVGFSALSRAIEADSLGLLELLVAFAPPFAFAMGVIWVWTLRPHGRLVSLVVGGSLVLFFGGWFAMAMSVEDWLALTKSGTLGERIAALSFGTPVLIHVIVLFIGTRRSVRLAFERRAAPD